MTRSKGQLSLKFKRITHETFRKKGSKGSSGYKFNPKISTKNEKIRQVLIRKKTFCWHCFKCKNFTSGETLNNLFKSAMNPGKFQPNFCIGSLHKNSPECVPQTKSKTRIPQICKALKTLAEVSQCVPSLIYKS